jgi:uncharacterized membrane protein YhhN
MRIALFAALTSLALGALLAAEYRGARAGAWVAKPLCSSGFVGIALGSGALETTYGRWVLLALGCSWVGDVLLIPRGAQRVFAAGMASFLLAHLAYCAAFLLRGVEPGKLAGAGLAVSLAGFLFARSLRRRASATLRPLLYAYVTAIAAMVALAAATFADARDPRIPVGAALFLVSDIAVARERFLAPRFSNKAWGLPLYYAGQSLLALSVG